MSFYPRFSFFSASLLEEGLRRRAEVTWLPLPRPVLVTDQSPSGILESPHPWGIEDKCLIELSEVPSASFGFLFFSRPWMGPSWPMEHPSSSGRMTFEGPSPSLSFEFFSL